MGQAGAGCKCLSSFTRAQFHFPSQSPGRERGTGGLPVVPQFMVRLRKREATPTSTVTTPMVI